MSNTLELEVQTAVSHSISAGMLKSQLAWSTLLYSSKKSAQEIAQQVRALDAKSLSSVLIIHTVEGEIQLQKLSLGAGDIA